MDILSLLIIIGIISSIYKNIKKQRKTGAGQEPEKPWQRMLGEFTKEFQKPHPPQTYRPLQPVRPVVRAPAAGGEGAADREGTADEEGAGNMEGRSLPGSLAHAGPAPTQTLVWHEPTVPQSALFPHGLQLHGDDLVRAVIMSEILTRPGDRKRGWNRR